MFVGNALRTLGKKLKNRKSSSESSRNNRRMLVESLETRRVFAAVTLTPAKDTTLFQTNAGFVSDGAGTSMSFGLDHQDDLAMRGLLAFDLSQIPAGSTINSVTLSVWVNLTFSNSTPSVELHKVTTNWGEGASAPTRFMPPYGTAKTNDATWTNNFYPSSSWTNPGGDFSFAVSSSVVIGADNKSYTFPSTSQLVADVQSWVNSSTTNFGWLIKGDETQESGKMIDTKESTTAAHRPTLTVNYTAAATGAPDMTISQTHSSGLRQGDTGKSATIIVSNSGNAVSSGQVIVSESFPSSLGLVSASGTGWTTTVTGSTLTATRSDALAAGASYPALNVNLSVADSAPSSVTTTANVTGGGETNTSNNNASDTFSITPVADLSITGSHSGTIRQGDSSDSYTLTVQNSGAGSTTGQVTVTDTLPTGLTPLSASGTGWTTSINGQTVTATRSDVLSAGSAYPALTILFAVAASASGTLTNSAHVSGGGELNTSNDTNTDPTTITAVADLQVSKSHSVQFKQGDSADTYRIVVNNSGAGPTVGTVTVVDTLPSGLVPVSASGNGWTVQIANGVMTATRSDALAAGASYPDLIYTVSVNSNAPASVTNSVTVSGGGQLNTNNDSASDSTTITQVADMSITAGHTEVFRQGDAQHAINVMVSNVGSGITSGTVTITDTLPQGLSFISASGTGWTVQNQGSTITATRSDALAGGAAYPTLSILVSVGTGAAASLNNIATVSLSGETNTANNSASDSITVVQAADLIISQSHIGSFERGNLSEQYSLLVSNSGAGSTTGQVTVTDQLPTGLSAISVTGNGWTGSIQGSTITATRSDSLGASQAYPPLILTVSVAADANNTVVNNASVSGGGEVVTNNNSSSGSTQITDPASDLTISKSHTDSFRQGDAGDHYFLVVHNTGSLASSGTVTVSDVVPAGMTVAAAAGDGWTASVSGNQVTAVRSDALSIGSDYPTLTVTVSVANDAPASITNTATVSGGGELDVQNDSASDATAVAQNSDLSVAVTHSGSIHQGDASIPYTIVVTNSGFGPTSGSVTVSTTLPTGLTYVSSVGTGWTIQQSGGTITATRSDSLAANTSFPTITLTTSVNNDAPSSIAETVTVSGGGDVNSSNDTATDTSNVIAAPNLSVVVSNDDSVQQGDIGKFCTVVVSNAANTSSTSGTVTVTTTLPSGLTATAAQGTGWSASVTGSSVTATRNDSLAAGASFPPLSISYTVTPSSPTPVTIAATVSGGGDLSSSDNSSQKTVTVNALPDLTIQATHSSTFKQGDTSDSLIVTVSNGGGAATSGAVTVTESLPAGLTAVSASADGWTTTVNGSVITATRSDTLAAGASYPALSILVGVTATAAATIQNTVSVTGGGQVYTANDSSTDTLSVTQVADLVIAKSHSGNFRQLDAADSYSITVSNHGAGATTGTVTIVDTLPTGLTVVSSSGDGWSVNVSGNTVTATRSDSLAAGSSYPNLSITVQVAGDAPTSVTNSATVAGGGELNTSNDSASDVTSIEEANASLSGYVFMDPSGGESRTSNGRTMHGLAGITVQLLRKDSSGSWVAVANQPAVQTDSSGFYQFNQLGAGEYRVQASIPKIFIEGRSLPGSINGSHQGTGANDQISVTLGSGQNGSEYDFTVKGIQAQYCSRRWSLGSTSSIDSVIEQLYSQYGKS
ncbi:MAG: hypothetical protein U0892_12180 [Pirellulales bacterium]